MALYHAYSQTVADGTATSVVRPSDWNSAHNQQITLAGNTAGQSTISGTNIAFQGGNNVTLSAVTAAGAATIIVSGANTVAQTVQTQASGAIAGTGFTSTTTAGSNITAAMGTNGLSMAVPVFLTGFTQSTQTQAAGNIAGTGFTSTTTAGTAVTAALGTNGLSMAVPAFITTFVNDLTSGRAGTGFTSTTTAGTAVTAALGTNGLSMAVPQYITTFVNDLTSGRAGTGFTSTTTAGTAITAALGTNGLSMAVPQYLTTYVAQTTQTQPAGNIAGVGYTSTTQAGSTVGITNNTAGLSAAWPPFITTATQSVQTQPSGAIAGTGFTSATTAGTAITAALGTNGLNMAVPAYITTYAAQTQQPMFVSASGTSIATATLQFGNSNGVSFSLTNGSVVGTVVTNYAGLNETTAATNASISLSLETNGVALSINVPNDDFNGWNLVGANTAGTTATTITTQAPFYLQGGNNITLSGNSNTIVISAGAGAVNQTGPNIAVAGSTITSGTVLFSNANGVTFGMVGSTITATVADPIISYYDLYELGNNSVLTSFGQNSLHFQLFVPGINLTMTGINMLASMSSSTSAASAVCGLTMSYGIYSKGSGTNSTRLESMATSSFFINAFVSSTTTASYAVGQVGSSYSTTSGGTVINSVLSGAKALQLPFATSLASTGEYAFVFAQSTSSVGNTNALRVSHVVMTAASGASASYGLINTGGVSASATSITQEFQQLVWSTTSGAWPATVAYNALSNNGASVNHAFAYFNA